MIPPLASQMETTNVEDELLTGLKQVQEAVSFCVRVAQKLQATRSLEADRLATGRKERATRTPYRPSHRLVLTKWTPATQ